MMATRRIGALRDLELAARFPVIEAICEQLLDLAADCDDGALLAAIEHIEFVDRDVDGGVHARAAAYIGGDQGAEPFGGGGLDGGGALHFLQDGRRGDDGELEQQFVLASEVNIKRRRAHPGAPCDIARGGRLVAADREAFDRGGHQLADRVVALCAEEFRQHSPVDRNRRRR